VDARYGNRDGMNGRRVELRWTRRWKANRGNGGRARKAERNNGNKA